MSSKRDNNNALSTKDFQFICQFVYNNTGIVLNEGKREMVYRRLSRIIREKELSSFAQYCQLLRDKPKAEMTFFINAITTNLTSFFRESHHFEYLAETELPKLIRSNKDKKIRIWSSACSTGEEPYSIAMTIMQAIPGHLSTCDVKILATDIDSNVLAKAKTGIYQDKENLLIRNYKEKYFNKGTGLNSNKIKANNNIQKLITFKQLNLLHGWPMQGPFDVIFCRNVVIYFDKTTQQELFTRYYELLKPGGLLILGHSESLGQCQQFFENIGRTIFRRK